MPNKLRLACHQPGCIELIQPGAKYCTKHKRKAWAKANALRREDPTSEASDRFYSTAVWRRARMQHIRSQPLCVQCGQPGRVVDHILRIRDGGEPLDPENLQTLCDLCHNRKRQAEGLPVRFKKS